MIDKLKAEQERAELESLRSGMPGKIRHFTLGKVIWSPIRSDGFDYYQAQQQVIGDKEP